MDAFLAIVSRREVRNYAERPIAPEAERRILEAGRISGSSMNRQPWRFVVAGERAERAAEAVYAPDNLLGAALVVAIVLTSGRGDLDAGRAAQNMMLAAWNDGIGSCPNGVADHDKLAAALELGDGERAAIVLSFGYPARPRDPHRRDPADWIARADRRPFDEIVTRL